MMEPSPYLLSDIEIDRRRRQEDADVAQKALIAVGDLLDNADKVLSELEHEDLLGEAIIRRCQEMADAVEHLAKDLEGKSELGRKELAQACLKDVQSAEQTSDQLSNLTEGDIENALSLVPSLLRDVESALRSIDRQEADEIADVTLTLARLFLMSLNSFHSSITPENLIEAARQDPPIEISDRIEILDEMDEENKGNKMNTRSLDPTDTEQQAKTRKSRIDRLRLLWPPLGPAVMSAAAWGKEEAAKKPLLAVGLGLTLWPAAIVTAMVGTPLVLADSVAQHVYNSISEGPIMVSAERVAAQSYHAGRLYFLCSRLAFRQTWKLAARQVERNGGMGKIAHNVAGMALDRALHPVETMQMTWGGVMMGVGAVQNATAFVQQAFENEMEKEKARMQ